MAKKRDSRGRFVKAAKAAGGGAIIVRPSSAPTRYVQGGGVTVIRESKRRRSSGGGRKKWPVKEMVVSAAAGYVGGKWLQGEAGKKFLAENEFVKKNGIGPVAAGVGLAICHFFPKYEFAGVALAAFGATTWGLRQSSEAKPEKQPLGVAGPNLAALAAQDVSGPDVLENSDGLEGDGY